MFIFLSFCFTPLIVVSPRKCANLFNAGSICILASFGLWEGDWGKFFKKLMCGDDKVVSMAAWTYLVSLLTCIVASLIMRNYILTIVTLVIELLCLLKFICSFFPYGA